MNFNKVIILGNLTRDPETKALPSGQKVSIGSEGSFDKQELISHIEKQDNIGDKIIEIQLNYLRALKGGVLIGE